jgi:hypothetical protein
MVIGAAAELLQALCGRKDRAPDREDGQDGQRGKSEQAAADRQSLEIGSQTLQGNSD